jgi:addiction module RelE/StbE family toxin
MPRIFISNKFKRSLKNFTRNNKRLQTKIEETIRLMATDLAFSKLGTHKLSGKLSGLLSCSCGYDCRIVFSLEKDDDGEELIILLDVGTHDEVY